jgi:hypothetical protein
VLAYPIKVGTETKIRLLVETTEFVVEVIVLTKVFLRVYKLEIPNPKDEITVLINVGVETYPFVPV